MKYITHQGTEQTLIFNPKVIEEGSTIIVQATTIFLNNFRYEMSEFICNSPNDIWFNLGEYSINKPIKRGAFRFLWKDDEGYLLFRSLSSPVQKNLIKKISSFIKEKIVRR